MNVKKDILEQILSSDVIKNIFNALDEGVLIVNKDSKILFYNNTLSRLEGMAQDDVMGKYLSDVFPSLTPEESTIYQVIKTGRPIKDKFQQYFDYKGKLIKNINTTIPIFDDNSVIGAIEVSRDMSLVINLTEKLAFLQRSSVKRKNSKQKRNIGLRYDFSSIIGSDKKIKEIKGILKRASKTSSPILIYGETGTGKELFAQSIHSESPRKHMPFIAQNCAALPESILESILFGTTKGSFTGAIDKPGLFEQADGGTILLDEINNMHLSLQTKLLRVLQENVIRRIGGTYDIPVDVKIIATTNEKPAELLKEGKLRKDLFFRLSVINVEIPPLRERIDDIRELSDYFIQKYNEKFNKKISGIDQEVVQIFEEYSWPGNVRELENVIEALMNYIDEGKITKECLRFLSFGSFRAYVQKGRFLTAQTDLKDCVDKYERNLIVDVLKSTQGNVTRAAKKLKIKRQLLQYYMKKYNISRKDIVYM
ncbi:MAG: sigma-54 interaction domain-containing protein [Tepidanaerobacteraceae bacterium]